MRIFALELNNEIKGLEERKAYIESLIARLPSPDLVLLPELALPSYIPNQKIWAYADLEGKDTSAWAIELASRYRTWLGVGYVDFEEGDYYNRYLIAGAGQVFGVVTKSEGEAAVFKRGWFDPLIKTPMGKIAVAICYDARRKHFYDSIKDEAVSLIVFPHGSPADPKKKAQEEAGRDHLCGLYQGAFGVPVVYVNSWGRLEAMPGLMGSLMKWSGFRMNGRSRIYGGQGQVIPLDWEGVEGCEVDLSEQRRKRDIPFFDQDLTRENLFFRKFVLKADIAMGIRRYQRRIRQSL